MNWYKFIKIAAYEDFYDKIESLSKQNPYPFKEWFAGNDRIYIPFSPIEEQSSLAASDQEVIEILQQGGCDQIDYRKGYCQQGGRTWKISKFLERIRKQELIDLRQKAEAGQLYNIERSLTETNDYYNGLLQQFINSSQRVGKLTNEFTVVISQNPHDVASMSTDRDWTSCMELGEGSHHEAVFCEVQLGSLVAYLVRKEDVDINNPLARIHIKRFENRYGESYAVQEQSVYGNELPGFAELVRQWLNGKQQNMRPGMYRRMGGEWSDTFDKEMLIGPTKTKDIIKWLRREDPDAKYNTWTVEDELASDYNTEVKDMYEQEALMDNTKTFTDEKEAEAYLLKLESEIWGDEDSREEMENYGWDSWNRRDPDDGEWEIDRYNLKENKHDNTYDMYGYALETIINAERGIYQDKIIKEIHDSLFKDLGKDKTKIFFAQKYPELITDEDREKIRMSDTLTIIRSLPEDQKEPYKQMYYPHILKTLDNPMTIYDTEMKRMAEIYQQSIEEGQPDSNIWDSLVMRLLGKLDSEIFGPAQELFKPIPEELSQRMVKFVNDTVNSDSYNFGKYNDSLMFYLGHTFSLTNSDTPTVQKYFEQLLSRWKENNKFFGEGTYGPINISTLGYYIGKLGENGQQFIPFIKERLKLEEERLKSVEGEEGHTMQGTFHNKTSVVDRLTRNVESYLYVLDMLQNKGQQSGKYRFFN